MDAKKYIKQYVNPSWILPIVLIIIFPLAIFGVIILLFSTLPATLRANKSIKKLESAGTLDQAAAEMAAPSAKRYMDGKLILTDHFVFCKRTGYIFTYDELLWVYKHRFTQRFLFIPIRVTDSVYAATATMKPTQVVFMGKDKMDQIKNAIVEIYNHNNRCMIGYTDQNVAAYKQLRK